MFFLKTWPGDARGVCGFARIVSTHVWFSSHLAPLCLIWTWTLSLRLFSWGDTFCLSWNISFVLLYCGSSKSFSSLLVLLCFVSFCCPALFWPGLEVTLHCVTRFMIRFSQHLAVLPHIYTVHICALFYSKLTCLILLPWKSRWHMITHTHTSNHGAICICTWPCWKWGKAWNGLESLGIYRCL